MIHAQQTSRRFGERKTFPGGVLVVEQKKYYIVHRLDIIWTGSSSVVDLFIIASLL